MTFRPHQENGPGLAGLSDEDCSALARSGSRPAQEELVRRHLPPIYRLCLKLLRNRDAAADATQEVFARALEALQVFDPARSFRAWLCAIAWNHVRDEARKRRRRRTWGFHAFGGAGRMGPRGGAERAFELEDRRVEPPEKAVERDERSRAVEEGLSLLKPRSRALVVLRDMEGLSYAEIGEMFGWKLGTVKSRVHRARMALKDVLVAREPGLFDERRT